MSTSAQEPVTSITRRVHRIEVWPRPAAGDPHAESVRRRAADLGVEAASVATARVYLIEAPLDRASLDRLCARLLADPVLESASIGVRPPGPGVRTIEVHPLPGVMDPVAQTVLAAARAMLPQNRIDAARVMTGRRYDLAGIDAAAASRLAKRLLANEAIEQVHFEAWAPEAFPEPRIADQTVRRVELTALDDAALERLSREGHLFLSLQEMKAVQDHFRVRGREPTDVELETLAQTWSEHCVHKTLKSRVTYRPVGHRLDDDVIDWSGRTGCTTNPDGSVTIDNLLKSTVAAATHELIAAGLDWALSVFVDNAGVVAFDDEHAVCMKVETHNRPSAIEPYGGAATGVGGCIRDIIGTGLGAKPIANTDVFCVAHPRSFTTADAKHAEGEEKGSSSTPASATSAAVSPLPLGCLHPRRILTRVVDGVRDYGNRMGIPTLNGAVYFDDRYVGNPLVFCGCVGVMPRSKVQGEPRAGDLIVALGGRTGRDGIHGATFSSAEVAGAHAEEFAHAVQIGNAIEEKRLLDAVLRARDGGMQRPRDGASSDAPASTPSLRRCAASSLYSAITDCGAGGFSSAVGEMGETLGAEVDLEKAPLKYAGLRYDEIWISESQERMVLAVPEEHLGALQAICDEEHVPLAVLGRFGRTNERDEPELLLRYEGNEVGRLSMPFLHDGIPMPVREAEWGGRREGPDAPRRQAVATAQPASEVERGEAEPSGPSCLRDSVPPCLGVKNTLLKLLAHPNIASKRWIVNQYDHEVQGATVVKPLVGPSGIGPGDAAVIEPVPGAGRGLAIACGLQTRLGHPDVEGSDPYLMALAAVDECVRNLVCVGADPSRIAILDNFCWPSCDEPRNMGALVRAAVGCYDAAKAYAAPFISGKDSLNNQFRMADGTVIEIPPTLLISGVGIVPDVSTCVTMDLKPDGGGVGFISADRHGRLRGSHVEHILGVRFADPRRRPDLQRCVNTARFVHELIREGLIVAAHDCSEGGELVAIAEMLVAAQRNGADDIGLRIEHTGFGLRVGDAWSPLDFFAEASGAYVVQYDATIGGADVWEAHRRIAERLGLLHDDGDAAQAWSARAPTRIGPNGGAEVTADGLLAFGGGPSAPEPIPVTQLRAAFLGALDW